MSTSRKYPKMIRQGGPGASHENAKAPRDVRKPAPARDHQRSHVSGGGGERDTHHTHEAALKGGHPDKP